MNAEILKLTLLPNVDRDAFERKLKDTILPKLQILRRNVSGQSYRLFRTDPGGSETVYVCLVFTKLVGSTPESAGDGPTVLCETPLPVTKIASDLSTLATITVLTEV